MDRRLDLTVATRVLEHPHRAPEERHRCLTLACLSLTIGERPTFPKLRGTSFTPKSPGALPAPASSRARISTSRIAANAAGSHSPIRNCLRMRRSSRSCRATPIRLSAANRAEPRGLRASSSPRRVTKCHGPLCPSIPQKQAHSHAATPRRLEDRPGIRSLEVDRATQDLTAECAHPHPGGRCRRRRWATEMKLTGLVSGERCQGVNTSRQSTCNASSSTGIASASASIGHGRGIALTRAPPHSRSHCCADDAGWPGRSAPPPARRRPTAQRTPALCGV